jgi:hypothetical protein
MPAETGDRIELPGRSGEHGSAATGRARHALALGGLIDYADDDGA